jgi:hypothetical protein
MKIIFICGSLEPGRDGVGDYTRRLAGAMSSQGHTVLLISIRDKYVLEPVNTFQTADGGILAALRIPVDMPRKHRFTTIKERIESFKPDWVSLQYVPFAYHDRGLHFGLSQALVRLGNKIRWHIMFHELWMGRDKNSSIKNYILSYLQQIQIRKLVKILQPVLMHTHLPLYKLRLNRLRIVTKALPLFSNINPVCTSARVHGLFMLAFFSQADSSKSVLEFIEQISNQAVQNGQIPELIMIGGDEEKMMTIAKTIQQACPQLQKVYATGFLDELHTSQVISGCDLGITPIPLHGLGKSGSVAAFLAHGVPVAAPVVDKTAANIGIGFFNEKEIDAIILEPTWENLKRVKRTVLLVPNEIHISTISKIFCLDLIDKIHN